MITKFLQNTFIILPIIYYMGASFESYEVLLRDAIYGFPFLLLGTFFLTRKSVPLLLLSSAYLSHVIFDLLYLLFIEDTYMIPFYEIFCIFYDLLAGIYLLKKRVSKNF